MTFKFPRIDSYREMQALAKAGVLTVPRWNERKPGLPFEPASVNCQWCNSECACNPRNIEVANKRRWGVMCWHCVQMFAEIQKAENADEGIHVEHMHDGKIIEEN